MLTEADEYVLSDSDFEPLPDSVLLEENGWKLVGHGSVGKESCGRYSHRLACPHPERHGVGVDGVDYRGMTDVLKVRYWCGRADCPVCYMRWVNRSARCIERRMLRASKHFGQTEHIILSLPKADYDLSDEAKRRKLYTVSRSVGVLGGAPIFHPFRYDRFNGWYWSNHFHLLGFIQGGYGQCRRCQFNSRSYRRSKCSKCDGFEGRVRRQYGKYGYIIKVKGERNSVFATARYQLSHCGVRRVDGALRFHAYNWFGVVSTRKMKMEQGEKLGDDRKKAVCRLCGSELVRVFYRGCVHHCLDPSSPDYKERTFEAWFEGDESVFELVLERSFGGG